MNSTAILVIVVLAAIAVGALLVLATVAIRDRRRARLQRQFGPEYQRAVARTGGMDEAEDELAQRQKRRSRLHIRELDQPRRDYFIQRWRAIEAQFVERPVEAVGEADQLISELMHERGYPIEDFERRASDISVDYPEVVENYRAARAIAIASGEGRASTEDHRLAVAHYRALCEQLLGADARPAAGWTSKSGFDGQAPRS